MQMYQIYKRVSKYWQKDNPFSKLLLDIYQNIFGIKVCLFIIIFKYIIYYYYTFIIY